MFIGARLRPTLCRSYMALAIPKGQRPSPKDHAVDPKVRARRDVRKKALAKSPPEQHPLYMDVPRALRYLRAAEVGRPAKRTTIALQMNVIPEKGSTPLQGQIVFPKPVRETKILVFSHDAATVEQVGQLNSSYTVGGAELIAKIQDGDVDLDSFTQCYATPDIVKDLKPIARALGPRGLMPTPKRNTVAENVIQLIEANTGAITFKQRDQHIAVPVGRCDFSDADIINNLRAASKAIYASQPAGTKKPNTFGHVHLSSTNGPSVVINIKE